MLYRVFRSIGVGLFGVLMLAGAASGEGKMRPIATQYIAALGDSSLNSGDGAENWGLWAVDPGPRGVRVKNAATVFAEGKASPAGWRLDPKGWWLEEHGLLMEAPQFPLPAGRYVVTGGRQVVSVLEVNAPDAAGKQSWQLAEGASLLDVTHLGCRAALYRPKQDGQACAPEATPMSAFPMQPGLAMPTVAGCSKQDYQVLIVIGMVDP